jgi:WD40 repeat protein
MERLGILERAVSTGKLVSSWKASAENLFSLSFHPGGRVLSSASRGNEIKLWDIESASGRELITLVGHEGIVFSVCFRPNGGILASGSADRTVAIWNLGHYDRHIAGNLDYQISRLPLEDQNSPKIWRIRK